MEVGQTNSLLVDLAMHISHMHVYEVVVVVVVDRHVLLAVVRSLSISSMTLRYLALVRSLSSLHLFVSLEPAWTPIFVIDHIKFQQTLLKCVSVPRKEGRNGEI